MADPNSISMAPHMAARAIQAVADESQQVVLTVQQSQLVAPNRSGRSRSRGRRQRAGAAERLSRAMSRILRHPNGRLQPDAAGWVTVSALAFAVRSSWHEVHQQACTSMRRDGEARFEVGMGGNVVRATRGHTWNHVAIPLLDVMVVPREVIQGMEPDVEASEAEVEPIMPDEAPVDAQEVNAGTEDPGYEDFE